MGAFELITTAIGLAMDAFAVAICKGLSTQKLTARHYIIIAAWFGGFQALMPAIGYLLGSTFEGYIRGIDHWVAFALMVIIGGNMIKEGLSKDEECVDDSLGVRTMLLLAVATSIDALAVGVAYAMIPNVNIVLAIVSIGVITFALSAVGVKVGNVFGLKYKSKAEVAGGIILILIGLKILLSDLSVLPF